MYTFPIRRSARTAVLSQHDNSLISVCGPSVLQQQDMMALVVQTWNTDVPIGEDMDATMRSHAIPMNISEMLTSFPMPPDSIRYVPCATQPWITIETRRGGIIWNYSTAEVVISVDAWKNHFNEKQTVPIVPRVEFGHLSSNDHVLLARVHRSDTALRWICLDVTANTVLYRISLGPASLDYALARFNVVRQSFIYLASLVRDDGQYYLFEIDATTGATVSQSAKPILGAIHFHVANSTAILL
jgi:hypothetical protein